ncbi:hypothetical protein JB92DRAFT_2833469 [Gautieria morchelliformis]|nr:hypothetical protein JB92DRAFT_2833469 [Gautieria morchelliformis]
MSTSNGLSTPTNLEGQLLFPRPEPAFKRQRSSRTAAMIFLKGVTVPLTSFNALYKVSVSIRKEMDLEFGDEIKSAKVDHAHLSKSRNGGPSNELYQPKDLAFLVKDWGYMHVLPLCLYTNLRVTHASYQKGLRSRSLIELRPGRVAGQQTPELPFTSLGRS